MKKNTVVLAILCTLIAGFANVSFAADDVFVDSNNENNNTNNVDVNTTVDNTATGGAATINFTNPRQFLQAPDMATFLAPGTPILDTEWRFFYSKMYAKMSVKQIEKMQYGFSFSSLWPGNWGGRVQFTMMGESLPENEDDVYLMGYWPFTNSNVGDVVLGTAIVVGKPDWTEAAFIGDAMDACKDYTGTRRVAIVTSVSVDGITTGASIGGSGAVSAVTNGSTGTAFAAGGLLGRNRTHADRITKVQIACMNDGFPYLVDKEYPPSALAVVKTAPAVKPEPTPIVVVTTTPVVEQQPGACGTEQILMRIKELEREVLKCTQYCFNNLQLRYALGDANIDLYVCTGDKKYLRNAMYHYGVAERNFRQGYDISAHKAEANQIMAQVYYNWAGCIRSVEGQKSAMAFAQAKHLERIPSGFAVY